MRVEMAQGLGDPTTGGNRPGHLDCRPRATPP